MAENNSSAPLLPCPFCGGAARMKPSTRGDYTSIVCNSPCAGPLVIVVPNDQIEAGIAAWNTRAPQAVAAQAPAAVADEMSPEFTDTARAALMWVLWHHQGSSSEIGTAMRFALGMGKFDRLNDHQLSEAKRWAEIKGVTKAASTEVAAPSKHLALQWCAGALQGIADEKATVRLTGFGETLTIGAILDMADKALATPALPATEDSSAGDLAEVQAEPVSSDPVAWHSKLYGTCWMHKQPYHLDAGTHFFVRGNPNPVATVLSGAAIQWHTGTAALEHGTFFYTAPQAQPADALTRAALDVLAERARQIGKEGYVPEADDSYVDAELAAAAATYALLATGADGWRVDDHWPWAQDSLKKGDARRMLEKAGALILAEMERLDRAAKAAAQEGGNA